MRPAAGTRKRSLARIVRMVLVSGESIIGGRVFRASGSDKMELMDLKRCNLTLVMLPSGHSFAISSRRASETV